MAYPSRSEWLATTIEEAVDAAEEILDPHHHLWAHHDNNYLVEELHDDTGAGHNVVQTVFVDCGSGYLTDGPKEMRPTGESAFAADQARQAVSRGGAQIAGIVSFADLCLGESVAEILAEHDRVGAGLFRGIRHANAHDPSPEIRESHTRPPADLFQRDDFREGFRTLGAEGYRFDAWLFHPQVPQLTALVEACPDTPVVLDHLGGPLGIGPYKDRRSEVRAELQASLADLAQHEQVSLKVGGIGMSIFGVGLKTMPKAPTSDQLLEIWRDDLAFAIDTFGPSRCMFESNFPVDKQGCSYTVLWNTFQKLCDEQGYSPDERADLFAGTARRFYGLASPA